MIPNTFKAYDFMTGHPHLGPGWTSNLRNYAGHIMWKQKVNNDLASKIELVKQETKFHS